MAEQVGGVEESATAKDHSGASNGVCLIAESSSAKEVDSSCSFGTEERHAGEEGNCTAASSASSSTRPLRPSPSEPTDDDAANSWTTATSAERGDPIPPDSVMGLSSSSGEKAEGQTDSTSSCASAADGGDGGNNSFPLPARLSLGKRRGARGGGGGPPFGQLHPTEGAAGSKKRMLLADRGRGGGGGGGGRKRGAALLSGLGEKPTTEDFLELDEKDVERLRRAKRRRAAGILADEDDEEEDDETATRVPEEVLTKQHMAACSEEDFEDIRKRHLSIRARTRERKHEEEDPQADDEETGIPLEPFNMRREREEGTIDVDGYYIFNDNSRRARIAKDSWLDSVDAGEAEASFKDEGLRQKALLKTIENQESSSSDSLHVASALQKLYQLLRRCETPQAALKRLGKSKGKPSERPDFEKFNHITELCDSLMGIGKSNS